MDSVRIRSHPNTIVRSPSRGCSWGPGSQLGSRLCGMCPGKCGNCRGVVPFAFQLVIGAGLARRHDCPQSR